MLTAFWNAGVRALVLILNVHLHVENTEEDLVSSLPDSLTLPTCVNNSDLNADNNAGTQFVKYIKPFKHLSSVSYFYFSS